MAFNRRSALIVNSVLGATKEKGEQGVHPFLDGTRSTEEPISRLRIPEDILNGVDQASPFFEQFERIFMGQSVGSRLFIDAIVQDQAISPTFYDGLKAQAVIEAALEADKRACWVSL